MKVSLLILFSLFLSLNVSAQRAKYKIFITDGAGIITKGKFIACTDNSLTILRRGDTLTVSSNHMVSLYLYKRGVVFPVTFLATTATLLVGLATSGLGTIIALPIAGGVSSLLAYSAAKRASYEHITPANFPEIKNRLLKYAIKP